MLCFFCFKQKTAYEMRISDWSSDVCSSDLGDLSFNRGRRGDGQDLAWPSARAVPAVLRGDVGTLLLLRHARAADLLPDAAFPLFRPRRQLRLWRLYVDRKSTRLNSSH